MVDPRVPQNRGDWSDYLPIIAASNVAGMDLPWGAVSPLADVTEPYDYNKATVDWQSVLRQSIDDTFADPTDENLRPQEYRRASGLGSEIAAQFLNNRDPQQIRGWIEQTKRYKNLNAQTQNMVMDLFNEQSRGRTAEQQENQGMNRYFPMMLALQMRGVNTAPFMDAISTMQQQMQARPEYERLQNRLSEMRLSGKYGSYGYGGDHDTRYSGTTVFKNWLAAKSGDNRARAWMIEKGFFPQPTSERGAVGPHGVDNRSMSLEEWKGQVEEGRVKGRRPYRERQS